MLKQYLNQLIGKKITRLEPGFGSYFTIDFGKDLEFSYRYKDETRTYIRGEWEIWIKMAYWEFRKGEETLLHEESSKQEMATFFKSLSNKSFLSYEITSETFDLTICIEDDITLYVITNEEDPEAEQWEFIIPEGKVFSAGPGTKLTLENY